MVTLEVLQPFGLRTEGSADLRIFGVGKHEIPDDIAAHWFVRGCVAEGRARIVAVESPAPESNGVGAELVKLMAMTVPALTTLAQERGIALAAGLTKRQIADAIILAAADAGATAGGE